jgi:hypothetical protein
MAVHVSLLNSRQLKLPALNFTEKTEAAFNRAFLCAARTLEQHMIQIQSVLQADRDRSNEQFYSAICGLFAKMCRNYFSYVWLEIEHDVIGSQLLMEQFYAAAITLTYLLEKDVDRSLFWEYVAASILQAHSLMLEVKAQLQQPPTHKDTLNLYAQLQRFLADHKSLTYLPVVDDLTYSWGASSADTTAKRASLLGLQALNSPARQLMLKVTPASWLELQLQSPTNAKSCEISPTHTRTNFTSLRDASHLCLHATHSILEVFVNQYINPRECRLQQQHMNALYSWFHSAHQAYQRQDCN